jgi:sulfoxide reductase heme-binding subunit YedZ
MRLWKAVGDASYMLLIGTLAIGPMAKLLPSMRRWLKWRRPLGIWFAITATLHAVLVIHGWAEWSLRRFLGYEFVPQLGREARLEPGFGLGNLVGVTALVLALILAGTSSDRALRGLGKPAWTWLHRLSQTVLILTLLHGTYVLYIHFTLSFHKQVPEPDWFRVPFLVLGLSVLGLQTAAFVSESRQQRNSREGMHAQSTAENRGGGG